MHPFLNQRIRKQTAVHQWVYEDGRRSSPNEKHLNDWRQRHHFFMVGLEVLLSLHTLWIPFQYNDNKQRLPRPWGPQRETMGMSSHSYLLLLLSQNQHHQPR
jgi:hypothetical protein